MLFAKYLPHMYQGADHSGRRVMNFESGGGSTSTSQTTIPEYAKPYMEDLLGRTQALSNAEYTPYQGERLAGLSEQQQAITQNILNRQMPGQFGTGTNLATQGGLGSMMYGRQAAGLGRQAAGAGDRYMGMATSPEAQRAFMSPYMQNVVDVQKQEAIRDAQKQQLSGNLAAARQGTYGGARQLLAGTERERNLGQQLANIQATGSQKAFEAAQQAQQFGSQLGLQGMQAGIQGAQAGIQGAGQATQAGSALGQLGIAEQQQFENLAKLQAAAAGEDQAMRQKALDIGYEDYQASQQYPYKQLGFMSDVLRGSSNLAGTGGKSVYEAAPSMLSQLVGPGLLGLGLYREFGR